jgi:hypothetical protein
LTEKILLGGTKDIKGKSPDGKQVEKLRKEPTM